MTSNQTHLQTLHQKLQFLLIMPTWGIDARSQSNPIQSCIWLSEELVVQRRNKLFKYPSLFGSVSCKRSHIEVVKKCVTSESDQSAKFSTCQHFSFPSIFTFLAKHKVTLASV